MESSVVFSGVILNKDSREYLKKLLQTAFPKVIEDKWVIHCHHMTICLGELNDKNLIDQEVNLSITAIAKSDLCVAVKVKGYNNPIKNKIPHITLAVNVAEGGKPQNSNDIIEWFEFYPDVTLSGVIKEVSYKKK